MTLEGTLKVVHLRPDGPQGIHLGLGFENEDQYKEFDEAMSDIPEAQRGDLNIIKQVAQAVGAKLVDD